MMLWLAVADLWPVIADMRRWTSMKLALMSLALVALSCTLAGCTFARYAKLRVQVLDQQTNEGIPKAQLRTFYMKPMLDMTYQRKDREKTDRQGFATLTIATNDSQRMIFGWTYGIHPQVSVEAEGYISQVVGVDGDAPGRSELLLIRMQREGMPDNNGAANVSLPVVGSDTNRTPATAGFGRSP